MGSGYPTRWPARTFGTSTARSIRCWKSGFNQYDQLPFPQLLCWTGGIAPYTVQTTTTPTSPAWQPLGPPTNSTSLLVPASNTAAFYRILGQ